jgi:transaldolase
MSGALRIEIYADGANPEEMAAAYEQGLVKGFTTNPTLMRKAGVDDYMAFAKHIVSRFPEVPVSFSALSDDFAGMEREAREISTWGPAVFVKIPITNTQGEPSAPLVGTLCAAGVRVNVTAVATTEQVAEAARHIRRDVPAIVSVFAGRIADTGRDPVPVMQEALEILRPLPLAKLLWASPREVLNVVQADRIGCHIITLTPDILRKLTWIGKDLTKLSLETVKMFHDDAREAGYVFGPKR